MFAITIGGSRPPYRSSSNRHSRGPLEPNDTTLAIGDSACKPPRTPSPKDDAPKQAMTTWRGDRVMVPATPPQGPAEGLRFPAIRCVREIPFLNAGAAIPNAGTFSLGTSDFPGAASPTDGPRAEAAAITFDFTALATAIVNDLPQFLCLRGSSKPMSGLGDSTEFCLRLPSFVHKELETIVKESSRQTTMSVLSPEVTQTQLGDPVEGMFQRFQMHTRRMGLKRVSYPREYKLAASNCVRLPGQSRYAFALKLNISQSMIDKWVANYDSTLAFKKGARK
ncbi:hypothetical protein DFH27DRAFT_529278 [Peziza echinospora]|nr:hypothetical protein DFH27DRAFT_529278 [Peziza echinospora]